MRIVCAGAGGFIGGHLVKRLIEDGHKVVAVDVKRAGEWYQRSGGAEIHSLMNLELFDKCRIACTGADWVFNLAANMGGIGFIEGNKLACQLSVLSSTNMLIAAAGESVQRFFYSSSACVYAAGKQVNPDVTALKEEDAYPADAEDGYGWEKLFTERTCRHFREDAGLDTRIARYHNVYGPHGTYDGGREKAPAAICRKVAMAALGGPKEIEIWGDGEQTRSFMYVDDCVEGTIRIMESGFVDPLNLGSSELVTINKLVDVAEEIAGVKLHRTYNLDAPQGVRGRNSDNTLIKEVLDWEPSITLRDGLEKTYAWIYDELSNKS